MGFLCNSYGKSIWTVEQSWEQSNYHKCCPAKMWCSGVYKKWINTETKEEIYAAWHYFKNLRNKIQYSQMRQRRKCVKGNLLSFFLLLLLLLNIKCFRGLLQWDIKLKVWLNSNLTKKEKKNEGNIVRRHFELIANWILCELLKVGNEIWKNAPKSML